MAGCDCGRWKISLGLGGRKKEGIRKAGRRGRSSGCLYRRICTHPHSQPNQEDSEDQPILMESPPLVAIHQALLSSKAAASHWAKKLAKSDGRLVWRGDKYNVRTVLVTSTWELCCINEIVSSVVLILMLYWEITGYVAAMLPLC